MRKTVVLGASPNSKRYSFLAVQRLVESHKDVVAVGRREGEVSGIKILTDRPEIENVDTITLYIGSANQPPWYDYILSLKPQRIIFNPGTENRELEKLAETEGIECTVACTLVMLSAGTY